MHARPLGRSGLWVGRLGLGTMTWGRDTDELDARDQLAAFLDAGGSLIDTGSSPLDGSSEALVGDLIAEFGARNDVVIASKAGSWRQPGRPFNTSRSHLLDSLDASLNRLRVDHIDLWQIHGWDAHTPLEETLETAEYAVKTGRVRYLGISNFSGWQTAQACTMQRSMDRTSIVTTQMEYSLLQRGIEREITPSAPSLGIGILPWSPLGRGVLTGKYRHGVPVDSRGGDADKAGWVQVYFDERGRRIVDAVATAAEGLGASPAEVALAWIRDRPGVIAPIIGARTVQQLMGALGAEDLVLPTEIQAALDEVSQPPKGYPESGWAQPS
jgi:aryl-alcohol dehydrogenase-like predicted oxidoreductase